MKNIVVLTNKEIHNLFEITQIIDNVLLDGLTEENKLDIIEAQEQIASIINKSSTHKVVI